MSEDEGKPKEESTAESQSTQEPQPDLDTAKLKAKLDDLQVERLADLHRALRETEARIDRKLENFKKFVEATEISGRAMAGNAVQESEDEKKKKAAMSLIAGTGLTID